MTPRNALARWRQALPAELEATLAARVTRFGPGLEALDDPAGQPLLALPAWYEGPPTLVREAQSAALFGYLAVRVHDDLEDEGAGDPGLSVLLAMGLQAEHDRRLFAIAPTDPTLPTLHAERWARYARAMVEERRARAGGVIDWEVLLDRAAPLFLPTAALLLATGRAGEVPALDRGLRALASAHQRFDDLVDAAADRAAGHRTRASEAFGFDFVEAEIARAVQELEAAAGLLPIPIPWVEARRDRMEAWHAALIERVLRDVLGG